MAQNCSHARRRKHLAVVMQDPGNQDCQGTLRGVRKHHCDVRAASESSAYVGRANISASDTPEGDSTPVREDRPKAKGPKQIAKNNAQDGGHDRLYRVFLLPELPTSLLTCVGMIRYLAAVLVLSLGCATGRGSSRGVDGPPVTMEPLVIGPNDVYDAQTLFERGYALGKQKRCDLAVPHYDRLLGEFPQSKFASAALYNSALCLHESGDAQEAAQRYERVVQEFPKSQDVTHSKFQLIALYVPLKRWDQGRALTDDLEAKRDLTSDERIEVKARRAELELGAGDIEQAASRARQAITYYRTRDEQERVTDDAFAASASYVLAETYRIRSEQVEVAAGTAEQQHKMLEERAQLLLMAQREYFNKMKYSIADWSARAGFRIGAMYETLWDTITAAPIPPPKRKYDAESQRVYEEEYRKEMATMIRPLLEHAIRYWELTLMMIERTGIRSDAKTKMEKKLMSIRARLMTVIEADTKP